MFRMTSIDRPKAAQSTRAKLADIEEKIGSALTQGADNAAEVLAPKIEDARSTFVDELLPRLSAAVAALTGAADQASARAAEAAAAAANAAAAHAKSTLAAAPQALGGSTKKGRKGGGLLVLLGLAAAAGAVATAVSGRAQPTDPWAPVTDPLDDPADSGTAPAATSSTAEPADAVPADAVPAAG